MDHFNMPTMWNRKDVVEIAYGYPGGKLVEMYRQGKVKLSGCVVTGNDPDLYCKKCKKEFYRQ